VPDLLQGRVLPGKGLPLELGRSATRGRGSKWFSFKIYNYEAVVEISDVRFLLFWIEKKATGRGSRLNKVDFLPEYENPKPPDGPPFTLHFPRFGVYFMLRRLNIYSLRHRQQIEG
jgi:hypothetical protein